MLTALDPLQYTGGSDPLPTVRCIASLPLTAWSQRQGLDHMTTVH